MSAADCRLTFREAGIVTVPASASSLLERIRAVAPGRCNAVHIPEDVWLPAQSRRYRTIIGKPNGHHISTEDALPQMEERAARGNLPAFLAWVALQPLSGLFATLVPHEGSFADLGVGRYPYFVDPGLLQEQGNLPPIGLACIDCDFALFKPRAIYVGFELIR